MVRKELDKNGGGGRVELAMCAIKFSRTGGYNLGLTPSITGIVFVIGFDITL